jgi:hypothetical protein
MSNAELLPVEWVDRIFKKLSVRYGQAFMRRWDGVETSEVHEDWAEQLSGFRRRPDCIAYALANLPVDKPPGVGEFRAICNAMPERTETLRIDYKRDPIPASVMAALDKLKEPREVNDQYASHKGWAYRLRDREAAGDPLSLIQRESWRDALGGT